jgi:hypothetical protein
MAKFFAVLFLAGIAWGFARWRDARAVDAWNCGYVNGMDREEGRKIEEYHSPPNAWCDQLVFTRAFDCGVVDGRNVMRGPPKEQIKKPKHCDRMYWLEPIGWRMIL